MKNVMLCLSGMLLATQINAQQVSTAVNVSTNTNVSTSYAYTVNGVKNQVNVKYSSNMQEVQDDNPVKSKTFTKSFNIDRGDKINLSNQFGSLTIKTWDKNEIKVDADIKSYAKTDEEAQKLLDDVSISATKDGDLVSYKTSTGDRSGNWGSSVRNGKVIWRREVKIHMTVYMPASNALTASQTYGPLNLEDFAGPTSLKVQYGNLTTGNLSNSNNYISVQYGKAALKDVNAAKIKQQYGDGLTINTIGNIELDAQYSSAKIGTIKGSANIKHQYGGGTTIETAGALTVSAQYTKIKVGNLKGNLNGKVQYGKITVDEVETGNKDITISGGYSDIDLGFGATYNGDFEVSTNYGGFRYGSNISAKKLGEDRGYNSVKNYSGQVGKGGAAKINIRTDYGSVTFK
ncbi:hypothetical protein [Pedobacter sp. Hv1]|uniref:hypothetical protein n=1 Tax=Pedobacter sp. Hv1 TaxID=1740090 RepID=UPI000AFEBBFE|nr:hypothetical protein [Pedobacter sp. Hv1]